MNTNFLLLQNIEVNLGFVGLFVFFIQWLLFFYSPIVLNNFKIKIITLLVTIGLNYFLNQPVFFLFILIYIIQSVFYYIDLVLEKKTIFTVIYLICTITALINILCLIGGVISFKNIRFFFVQVYCITYLLEHLVEFKSIFWYIYFLILMPESSEFNSCLKQVQVYYLKNLYIELIIFLYFLLIEETVKFYCFFLVCPVLILLILGVHYTYIWKYDRKWFKKNAPPEVASLKNFNNFSN